MISTPKRQVESYSQSGLNLDLKNKIWNNRCSSDRRDGKDTVIEDRSNREAPSPSRPPPLTLPSPQPRPPPDAFSNPPVSSFPSKADYRRESDRLESLKNWPAKEFMNVDAVAKTGLYYYGDGDKVRCQFCRVVLSQWTLGDDAETDHSRWSGSCPLLLGKPVGNIPNEGKDDCGIYEIKSPKHPNYMTEVSRVNSFNNWPSRMRQSPQALADAGFYYAGSLDQTVCFYCGGGLKDWEDDDDPWEQHAIWFTRCHYLNMMKGEDFINSVLKAKASPEECSTQSSTVPKETVNDTQLDKTPNRETESQSDDKACKICFVNERNTCFIPCGHVVACPKCAMSVSTCPICRKEFTTTVKLYFS